MADIAYNLSEAGEDTLTGRYLIYKAGDEHYGIEIKYVTEIINITQIAKVPGLPHYLKGVINLRGSIIPVMDVRLRFNIEEVEYSERTCIIISNIDGMDIGLIVDSVSEVLTVPDQNILPPPETSKTRNRFVNGIGKAGDSIIFLLDYHRLIDVCDEK
jgi:purine-binding chemotaxis protein CheW